MNTVEIIAQNRLDAINAQKGKAWRIELVSALSEGGLTPTIGMVKDVLNHTSIELAVMIRPMSNGFYYDKHYLDVMKYDIEKFEEIGVKRIVLGILDKNSDIDFDAMKYVLENSKSKITFHRAIDSSRDILKSVNELNSYTKVTHILTSGGQGKAIDNMDVIKEMIKISRAKIMVGSGLNLESVDSLKKQIDISYNYDIHYGTFVQDENKIVSIEKVSEIVDRFNV